VINVTLTGPLAYAAVFVAAVIEGEVVFVTASVLVAAGKLDPLGVLTCGALGAAAGDQMFFYAFRNRIEGWLTRSRAIAARHANIIARVQRHQVLMIFAIRFAPGLRIAMTAACAYGNVSAWRFTTLNLISAFAWAVALMALVSRIGPGALQYAGITGIWGALVPAALIVLFGWWLGREPGSSPPPPTPAPDHDSRVPDHGTPFQNPIRK
jgi:membrane protein DedA with SNARE-associated domain